MEKYIYEGENLELALAKGLEELNVKEKDIIYKSYEVKSGLFKKTQIKVEITLLKELADFIKQHLSIILEKIGIEANIETKIRNDQIIFKMFSNNNQLLIGRNGRTLEALQTILKQIVQKELGLYPYLMLDVENYKEKQQFFIEKTAKRVAKEVIETKIDATLDSMNSYERRIVHNILADFDNIITKSEGESPNRYVVIKYKEEEND